jgi:hypothetical protein
VDVFLRRKVGPLYETHLQANNQFWLRCAVTALDQRFELNRCQTPPMLQGHAVTIILARETICSFTNHSTGTQCFYRPTRPNGPYRKMTLGSNLLGFFLICAWSIIALLFQSQSASVVVGLSLAVAGVNLGMCSVAWRHIHVHNAKVDEELQGLFAMATVAPPAYDRRTEEPPRKN